jgi:hypothetical protein
LFTWRKRCFCRYANEGCLSWSVGIATLRLGWTIVTFTWVSLISNRLDTLYVPQKLSFGRCWLCSCTKENSAFRGEDLEAVACKPIRNTAICKASLRERNRRR